MRIWILNPFDELPGDTDVRHRYWSLAEKLACPEFAEGAEMGHEVTWWSSDFSHRSKAYRTSTSNDPRPTTFDLRLIPTPPYARNVSLARLRNHRAYAQNFLRTAMEEIGAGRITPPERIVVSLPPLGTAEAAFALREKFGGEVVLDIMDAWPESFYRVFPGWVPQWLRGLILDPLRRSARQAYRGADRISAVSEIYLELARARAPETPVHLCYHGIDLDDQSYGRRPATHDPLKIAYIGALERSYDLETAIRAVEDINESAPSPGLRRVQLHIAGAGTHEAKLKEFAASLDLSPSSSACPSKPEGRSGVTFHGLLGKDELAALLDGCQLGLIPMRQDSWVGLPYKIADYCAAALPVISSLDGECRRLLETKKAGSFYEPANVAQLVSVIKTYLQDSARMEAEGKNARKLAEELFDRRKSYRELAEFVIGG